MYSLQASAMLIQEHSALLKNEISQLSAVAPSPPSPWLTMPLIV